MSINQLTNEELIATASACREELKNRRLTERQRKMAEATDVFKDVAAVAPAIGAKAGGLIGGIASSIRKVGADFRKSQHG